MKKEKVNPNRHMGKYTGYELINGEYHLAPVYQERFGRLIAREYGIKTLVNSINEYFAGDLAEIGKQSQQIYKDIAEDIGIDIVNEVWNYNGGILKCVKKIEDKKKEI